MLMDEIQNQLITARKSKDSFRLTLLNMLKSAIRYNNLVDQNEKREEIRDELVLRTIQSEIKKRKEAITLYIQGHRPELAEKEEKEILILKEFLPAPISDKEIELEIEKIISEINAKDMKEFGKVMKLANQTLKGKADGLIIKNIVEKKLNKN